MIKNTKPIELLPYPAKDQTPLVDTARIAMQGGKVGVTQTENFDARAVAMRGGPVEVSKLDIL